MDDAHNGGPAFPRPPSNTGGPLRDGAAGMTLLDYYAGLAMTEAIRAWRMNVVPTDDGGSREEPCMDFTMADKEDLPFVAETAYDMAEAMIAERKKRYG